MLRDKRDELSDDEKELVDADHMRDIQIGVADMSEDEKVLAIQMTKSLQENQTHVFYHVPSCIKKTNSTVCRYHFPRKLVETTGFDAHGVFEARRRIGNQWLNSYVPVWRECFRDNMDAALICDGSGAQKTLYCTKYATKHQSLIDNVHVIEMAYEKKLQKEDPNNDQYRRGLGRLLSLAYASTGSIEVGGPLATHYILRGEAAYFSHQFVPLLLTQGLKLIDEEDVVRVLEQVEDHYRLSSGINDYMFRDETLGDVSLYTFCSWYVKKKKLKHPTLRFTAEHVQADTHMLQRRLEPFIPEIIGPRLPDNRLIDSDELEEQYYRMVLCLYKPFRHPKELIQANGETVPAKRCFEEWIQQADESVQKDVKRRLEFHQEYHYAMDSAKQYHERMREESAQVACNDANIDTEGAHRHHDATVEARTRATASFEDMWHCLEDEDADMAEGMISASDVDIDMDESMLDVQHLIPPVYAPSSADDTNAGLGATVTARAVKNFGKNLSSEESSESPQASSSESGDQEVKVATLRTIMEELTSSPPTHTVVDRPYPTVNDVSKLFTLNELQHVAFTRYATPLLHKIVGVPFDAWDATPLYVTGAGGTGKSQIVGAVQHLITKWGRPNAVRVVAPTGVAAAALGGTTLHASILLPINAVNLPTHLQHPAPELLEQWLGVYGVILDELSMIGTPPDD